MVGTPISGVDADTRESSQSAVSWAAILAGTAVALAVVPVLMLLGAGLGLTSVSPWSGSGVSATTFSIMSGIGLIVIQWIASGLGGYVTGRLRTRWHGTHTHEVFFRDTAHGLVTWALATLVGFVLLASAVSSVVSGGASAVATVAGGAAQGASGAASQLASSVSGYDVDTLFRSDRADANASPAQAASEATRIIANGLANGDVPAGDKTYLAQLVSNRTGISTDDARKRVDEVIDKAKAAATKAKQAADAARKAAAQTSIFTALSLLIGAFIACVSAAYAGSLRDEHP